MTLCEASDFAGITFWAALLRQLCWSSGQPPHSYTGARAAAPRRMKGAEDERGKARHMPQQLHFHFRRTAAAIRERDYQRTQWLELP